VCPCSRCPIVRGRAEPVKAVCDRRATASVNLPGERTREDGLDRTCPPKAVAAIGSMGTSGRDAIPHEYGSVRAIVMQRLLMVTFGLFY
jgi:hypothetical protein